jgi:hypothetical protein
MVKASTYEGVGGTVPGNMLDNDAGKIHGV